MRRSPGSDTRRRFSLERLEPRWALDASALRITEFVASNDNSFTDYDGDSSDWVELYNPSAQTVNLQGLYLTDRQDRPTKWAFPAGAQIEAGGYLVVFASSKDPVKPGGEVHTSFALSADGEFLGLFASDGATLIHGYSPEFPPQSEDVSYGLPMSPTGAATTLVAAGAQGRGWRPTSSVYDATWTSPTFNDAPFNLRGPTGFGYEQSPGDATNFSSQIGTTVPTGTTSLYLRIPFELTTLAGIDRLTLRMKYDDGFVAYLNGVPIAEANAPDGLQWNATATGLHDDSAALQYVSFDASAAIGALRVGTNVLAIHGLNTNGASSDFLIVPELVAAESALGVLQTPGFFETPTPGYGNGVGFAGFAADPQFSVPHGFYTSAQLVAITSATPQAVIVYTTNGSTPTVNANLTPTNGQVYTGPITVSSSVTLRAMAFRQGFKPSYVGASSYFFLDDVIAQSPTGQTPPGWAPNGLNGQELNYGIDPDIINQYGAQAVKNALASLPTIALTTDLANLFNAQTGIYVNADRRGREWERAASVELIPSDGSEGFSTNAGLRIRGGYSRGDFNPKHAFRLYFRGEYGDGKLNYPLFGDEGVDEFNVLDLRTAQNYSWSGEGNTQNTFLREVFARDTQAALGQPYTRSEYYHLYLNGQYWGIFMTQERVEEFYGESYFGGDETDYDVVKADLAVSGGTEIADGNDLAWRALFDLAQGLADNPSGAANNYWTMQGLNPDGTRNSELPVLLDVDNLVDYMLIIFYTGGYDTGLSRFLGDERSNNWFGIRNRETGDQGFQFFMHDNEHSMGAEGNVHGTLTMDRTGPFYSANDRVFAQFNPHFLHQDLLVHPEYKQAFIDRVQETMLNGGPLTSAANTARLQERRAQVDPAIIAEAARWGDSKVAAPRNKTTWQTEVNWLVNTYLVQRGATVLSQLRGDGLFSSFAAPAFSQHGGPAPAGFQLSISGSGGTIYYTTDGATDPRLIGGGVNPAPQVAAYSGPITLSGDTTVFARIRAANGQWSGLVEATFSVANAPGDYDGNGLVEQLDWGVWRATFGSTTDRRADGNADGQVDAADYTVWRDAYSAAQFASASTAAVAPTSAIDPQAAAFASLGAEPLTSAPALRSSTAPPARAPFAATPRRADLIALLLDAEEAAEESHDAPPPLASQISEATPSAPQEEQTLDLALATVGQRDE